MEPDVRDICEIFRDVNNICFLPSTPRSAIIHLSGEKEIDSDKRSTTLLPSPFGWGVAPRAYCHSIGRVRTQINSPTLAAFIPSDYHRTGLPPSMHFVDFVERSRSRSSRRRYTNKIGWHSSASKMEKMLVRHSHVNAAQTTRSVSKRRSP